MKQFFLLSKLVSHYSIFKKNNLLDQVLTIDQRSVQRYFFEFTYYNCNIFNAEKKILYQNFINVINLVYYLFLKKCHVYIYSPRMLITDTQHFNTFITVKSGKRTPIVFLSLVGKINKNILYNIYEHNIFLIKPVNNLEEYQYSSYPLLLTFKSELSIFIFLNVVKYLYFKANQFIFMSSFKHYMNYVQYFYKKNKHV